VETSTARADEADAGTGDAPLRITAVDLIEKPGQEAVCHLTRPHAGEVSSELAVEIRGWAARSSRVDSVEVVCEGRVCRKAGVEAQPPRGERARGRRGRVYFHTVIGAFRIPRRFRLSIVACLKGGERVRVAEIRGERESLFTGATDGLRPIFISTPSGRTGTSWMVDLLGRHPGAVAYPPVGVEPRVAAYWLDVASALAEPQSYKRMLRPQIYRRGDRWWLGDGAEAAGEPVTDDVIRGYLGRENVRQLASWARAQIAAFYAVVARDQGKENAEAFVEKAPLDRALLSTLADLFPDLRELLMFRDPRDTLCSILAYKEKNPAAAFQGDRPGTGDAYMRRLAQSFRVRLRQSKRSPRAMVVRYEDLVTEPASTLRAVLTHAGLDASEEVIRRMLELDSAEEGRLADHRTTATAQGSIGRWRKDMDASLQARATEAFRDVLIELGYPEDVAGA
jgi:hypothetical protein